MNRAVSTRGLKSGGKAGWIVLLAVAVAVVADTRFNPVGGKLRMLVLGLLPLLVLVAPNVGRTVRRSSGLGMTLGLIVLAGAVSSVACVAPILGFLKLGFFVAVVVPLVTNRAAQEALLPGTRTHVWLNRGANIILLLCLAQTVGVVGFVDNPNKLAAFAIVTLPWKLVLSGSGHRRTRLRARIAIVLLFGICVASHSRGAVGGFLISLIVFRYSGPARSVLTPIAVGAILIVGLGLAVEMSPQLREYVYKDREQFLDDRRQTMLQDTMQYFRERPVLGYGFGLSWNVRPEHVEAVLRTGRLSWFVGEFGNSTLAIMAGGGGMLLAAFGVFFVAVLRFVEGSFRNVCTTGTEQLVQRSLFGTMIGMLAYSQVEGWLLSPLNWISVFFWLYVGMALRLASGPKAQARRATIEQKPIEEPGALLAKAQRIAEGGNAEGGELKNEMGTRRENRDGRAES